MHGQKITVVASGEKLKPFGIGFGKMKSMPESTKDNKKKSGFA